MILIAELNKEILTRAAVISAALSVSAIHVSPALASLGMAAWLISALLLFLRPDRRPVAGYLWLISAVIGWQFITQLITGIQPGTADKVLLKLPLLLLPLLMAGDFRGKTGFTAITAVSLVFTWLGGASVLNYLRHFRFLNQMVLESKPLPLYSQVYHIEFSLILALVSLCGLFVALDGKRLADSFWRSVLLVSVICNVVILHVLSVRTGMLAFWIGIFVAGGYLAVSRKEWRRYLAALTAVLVLLALTLPSIRNRVVNTWRDLQTVKSGGDVNDMSFGRRWEAWKVGLGAAGGKPLTGYGMGGVEEALQEGFAKSGSTLHVTNRIMPHNQYLDFTLQSGLTPCLLYLMFLLSGLYYAFRQRNYLLMAVAAAFLSAGMFESFLERQAGILALVFIWIFASTPPNDKNIPEKIN